MVFKFPQASCASRRNTFTIIRTNHYVPMGYFHCSDVKVCNHLTIWHFLDTIYTPVQLTLTPNNFSLSNYQPSSDTRRDEKMSKGKYHATSNVVDRPIALIGRSFATEPYASKTQTRLPVAFTSLLGDSIERVREFASSSQNELLWLLAVGWGIGYRCWAE